MDMIDAAHACPLTIGGDIVVNRLGYGAMRLTGPGIWGEPKDRPEALRVLKRLPELGVNFIDTADSYGPEVSENLIAEALHPYDGLTIATKGGLVRYPNNPGQWPIVGNAEYLRQCVYMSLRRLRVEQIDLWQLHRIDPTIPQAEQFETIKAFLDEGLIRHAGLSQVSVEQIEAARKVFPVSTVQNRYNLSDRADEDVLDYCEANGIGMVPVGRRQPRQTWRRPRHTRQGEERYSRAGRARLGAEAQPGDVADPGNQQSLSPRGKHRRGGP